MPRDIRPSFRQDKADRLADLLGRQTPQHAKTADHYVPKR
ncbi:hypothetical protein Z950_1210 [Sulfitobacter mediterraneus KCTC 32188]|nr:hypothetical protein Z950_1210 [Sulfitobacter mediterraneus KCTC 32188]